jgi:phenylalanyl-tRNA synthetase beta chain
VKASYSWLRSLLPGLDASVNDVAERLTRSGLEVEEIIEYGAASPKVVVAEVRKVDKHPDRERLSLVTVERGGGEQTVVCGAPNVPAPGRKVVLAPLGTTLPTLGFTVSARKIGGIVSEGMLCSEQELGLVGGGGKGDGIIVLPEGFAPAAGTSFDKAALGSHDFIFDIGVTPNRPDALGHIGLARELAALFELNFLPPTADAPAKVATGSSIDKLVTVDIDDTDRCPHYGAAAVIDVKIAPSPMWLRYRLESLGIRAISNVVDVTNLVLMEFAHPIHAFDLDLLTTGKVLVRRARGGEKMVTIDHIERELSEDDLLITDGERPIALAGVMGGADSEIHDGSRRVLIECAYFTPRGVRRTSRRHGLHSEASHRYERGIDPEGVPDVLAHAASLVTRICSGQAVPGTIVAGIAPAPRKQVLMRHAKMTALLGVDIPMDEASGILSRLGCEVSRSEQSSEELNATIPGFRPDLGREEDLIEEVMRIHGIDELPATPRAVLPKTGRSDLSTEDRARRAAAELGLSETLTYGFVSPAQLEHLGAPKPSITLKNPLTAERSVMRTSLLPGLLEACARARRHGVVDVRLFATGRTFLAPTGDVALPEEKNGFAAVIAGYRSAGLRKPDPVDVYDAKGIAMALVERVSLHHPEVRRAEGSKHLHPRAAGELYVGERCVARFGEIHPNVADAYDIDGTAMVIEIDLDALRALGRATPQYRAIPNLPPVTRDLALVVSDDVSAGELEQVILTAAGELCESVELFDLFDGKGVPDDHRSLAYHLVFRDPKSATEPEAARTLTDDEVDARSRAVVAAVSDKFGAVVRA